MKKRNNPIPMTRENRRFFNKFYEDYKNYMYFTARKYADAVEDCEDLVHDAIVRLIHNIPTLKGLNHLESLKYISLTVKSVYLDNDRIRKKDGLVFLDDAELEDVMIEQLVMENSDSAISAKLKVQKLKSALPAKDWLLLDAKYNLGLSQEEIGKLINVAPDSVRMLLHRARKKAKRILATESAQGG